MNAQDALKRTRKAIQEDLLTPTMELIYKRITERCDEGHTNLSHIFQGHTIQYHIRDAVIKRLEKEGYVAEYHEGSHQDQREVSYHEIHWDKPTI